MQPIPPEELHDALAEAHYDLYKEVHGIRPRWYRYSAMSIEELETAVLRLQEDVQEIREDLQAEVEWLAQEDAASWRQAAITEAQMAELEAREAVRAHEERWMDAAASMGAAGW